MRKALLVAVASVLASSAPRAAEAPVAAAPTPNATSIIEPERITAGSADQFLAVLDPAGERLVWVSNENATNELFGLEFSTRVPQRLFDDAADATIPRVSPDGKRLLYLSFRSAATGELCVRDLKKSGLQISDRKCLAPSGRNVMQALWEANSKTALVVSREGLSGEIDLRRFTVEGFGGDDKGELIVKRDLSSPALSPDGKWLLYVPVRRAGANAAPTVNAPKAELNAPNTIAPGNAGPSPVRANRLLGLIQLGGKGAKPAEPRDLGFALPGLPGFPAFSPDGSFVYFVQYLNDTNFDGVVDANDRAVLFRAPFDSSAENPLDTTHAEQLTSADWDCQYPFPGKERLIATCLNSGSLDIYSLPLDGVIPRVWGREQVLQELTTNRSPWQRLHLYTRMLELDDSDPYRALHLKRIIEMHLQMREYQSAGFYSGQLERLAAGKGAVEPWPEEHGIGQAMHELARHRRSLSSLGEGQATQAVEDAMHERVTKLKPLVGSPLPAVSELASLVESEIDDVLGQKALALARLEAVRERINERTRPVVLHLYGQRARELFESLGEREKLLQADLLLSQHAALEPSEQVTHAEDHLRDLLRGRAREDQKKLLDEAAKKLPAGSNAAFAVELEQTLQPLRAENQLEIEQQIFALMEKNPAYERGRIIVQQTVARARAANSEVLWYDVAEKWTKAVSKQNTDRKRTEAIFKRVATERAYIEWARGDLAQAETHFDAVTRHTSSLEAYAGGIDTQLLAGKPPAQIEAALRDRFAAAPGSPELLFSLSYLGARKLPAEPDANTLAKKAEEAKVRLKSALQVLPNSIPIHYLWAYLRHEEYLRTGESATALRANAHYQVVVDLARDEPRYRAAALSGLGFLHAQLGNHAMANNFLEEREKLPFANPSSQLAVCMQRARSLLHADRGPEAAAESDRCVALIDKTPALARFLPYALDRAALHHLDAGEPLLSQDRYDRLETLLKSGSANVQVDAIARRNQFVIYLARASMELSLQAPTDALESLDLADALFHLPGNIETLESTYAAKNSPDAFTQADLTEDYEALLTGLRARALTAQGKFEEAKAPTERRLVLMQQRSKRDGQKPAAADDQRFMALIDLNLAVAAYKKGDVPGAIARIELGLLAGDDLAKRTATPLHHVIIALLALYAEMHFAGQVPLKGLKMDLPGRLSRAYAEMVDHPQPRFEGDRAQFSIYLNRLMLEGVAIQIP
jgi:hypothetical protein